MTLEQLRIFVEVAALEHITKAAARLNMTQSAVSAAVTSLEARHGVTLFDRVGRSVVLNHTGRLFLKQALAVLASAKAAEAALMDLSGLMHGELSIMASQTIGSYWLPAKLAAYRTRYPGIRLDVRIGNTAEVADAVSLGEVEVGLIEWPTEKRGVTARQVAVDTMIIVVAPGHPWAGTGKSIGEFQGTPWVLREPGSGTRRMALHATRPPARYHRGRTAGRGVRNLSGCLCRTAPAETSLGVSRSRGRRANPGGTYLPCSASA